MKILAIQVFGFSNSAHLSYILNDTNLTVYSLVRKEFKFLELISRLSVMVHEMKAFTFYYF